MYGVTSPSRRTTNDWRKAASPLKHRWTWQANDIMRALSAAKIPQQRIHLTHEAVNMRNTLPNLFRGSAVKWLSVSCSPGTDCANGLNQVVYSR